jgi:hypothetical protein
MCSIIQGIFGLDGCLLGCIAGNIPVIPERLGTGKVSMVGRAGSLVGSPGLCLHVYMPAGPKIRRLEALKL